MWIASARSLALAAFLVVPVAFAQTTPVQAPPARIRGDVVSVSADRLTVATKDRGDVSLALPATLTVNALRRLTPADIAPGDFLLIVAHPAGDALDADAVTVVPPGGRRPAEGQFPWDTAPNSLMTNATVSGALVKAGGGTFEVSFNGRTQAVHVAPTTPIVQPVPASRADLTPGTRVFLFARPSAEGVLTALGVTVAKDGVAPPM